MKRYIGQDPKQRGFCPLGALGPGSVICENVLVPQAWRLSGKDEKAAVLDFYGGFLTQS